MKRRSKLSLSPAQAVPKKSPPGFDDSAGRHATQRPAKERSPPGNAHRKTIPDELHAAERVSNSGIDGKKIVKVLVVLVVSSLSIYLLKRRFFL